MDRPMRRGVWCYSQQILTSSGWETIVQSHCITVTGLHLRNNSLGKTLFHPPLLSNRFLDFLKATESHSPWPPLSPLLVFMSVTTEAAALLAYCYLVNPEKPPCTWKLHPTTVVFWLCCHDKNEPRQLWMWITRILCPHPSSGYRRNPPEVTVEGLAERELWQMFPVELMFTRSVW